VPSLVTGARTTTQLRHAGDVDVDVLPDAMHDDAVALWHAVDLTRPWNDPATDLRRALRGPDSTVLAALDGGRLRWCGPVRRGCMSATSSSCS
jgi:hypothetical protein